MDVKSFKKELLSIQRVGLDSMCFIYQFTDHPKFIELTDSIFTLLTENRIQATTSTITLVEAFVQVEKTKNLSAIAGYEKTFRELPNLKIVPIDWEVARQASQLRARYESMKTADALQIAATLFLGYKGFITNDVKLRKVKELRVIHLSDYL